MDFDLFESDTDDELLSAFTFEPTQITNQTDVQSETLPEFQCQGEDLPNTQFSMEGFVRNGFLQGQRSYRHRAIDGATITKYEFGKDHLNGRAVTEFVLGEACMNVQYLIASVNGSIGYAGESTHYTRRRQITLLLHMILEFTHTDQYLLLRSYLSRLRSVLHHSIQTENIKLIYFANSNKGNECNIPAYHLLHGYLEWRFLDLCILHKYEMIALEDVSDLENSKLPGSTQLISLFDRIFDDLLSFSIFWYIKKRTAELLFTSPYPCTCIKEMWLLVQYKLENWSLKSNDESITFWFMFNKAMERIRSKIDCFSLSPLTYCEFSNWMQQGLVRLNGFRSNGQFLGSNYARVSKELVENYEFCERITQQFLTANPSEEQLRIFIGILTPVLLDWWQPKVNVAMVLWEYFHKKLNAPFYIAGTAPSNLAVVCASGRAYVDKYRKLLSKNPDANLSSYTLFVILTGKCLQRMVAKNDNHQAQKLLGRIYAKFSVQKFLALSDVGIHHLIELFLVLALCGDFIDLSAKLKEKLISIALEKITPTKQIAVTKGHMALLILFAEHQYDLTDYVTKLLAQLTAIRNDLSVSKIIADSLLDIFEHADTFQRGEHLLVSIWICNFLNNCTMVEQERTLEALHLIFKKIQNTEQFLDANNELRKSLHTSILPFVKQRYISTYSHWITTLAADFCTHTFAITETQHFRKLFSYFTEQQLANRQAVPQFLLKVLESERKTLIDHSTVMQIWIRSLVLLTATNEDVVKLTKIVSNLKEFEFMTQIEPEDLLKAKEPLCVFIASVGKAYDATNDHGNRKNIANNFNVYIQNFEKWLNTDLKKEKSELTFRFYSFLAIVIFNCPYIAYEKSKITCFLHIAMTRYILPTSIQMGRPPEGKLGHLVHKIWPVLVQGIGRLNFKTDAYVTKSLTDLIQKWTPHFKISSNAKLVARPYITCLQGDNNELSLFIFEKLTALFLATQRRQADPNACLVITIYQEVVEAINMNSNDIMATSRLETFLKGCCFAVLEHIMMVDEIVPSRTLLLDLFKRIFKSPVYQQSMKLNDLLAEHLRILTKKHLSYYAFFYFDLLMKLCAIYHKPVEDIMPFLMDEIRVVEEKRGAGEDKRIRSCLYNLQQCILAAKQKQLQDLMESR